MNFFRCRPLRLALLACLLPFMGGRPAQAATSSLWGDSGELWLPSSRLPDFSHAGYRGGEVPIPDVPVVTNVKNFGAVGDGVADDSDAFLNALKATTNGAILIPAGRYKITEQIQIKKSNVVFRGAGQEVTTLYFPSSLDAVAGPAEDNAPGGSWSWSGGFFQVPGTNNGKKLASVTVAAKQGDKTLTLSTTAGMSVGQRIRVISWNTDGSWARYILGNLYPEPPTISGTKGADFPCKIMAIQGNTITLDRPLRTDIRLVWNPEVASDLPSLHDIGFEDMTLEFPEVPYPGHHSEPGFNGFDLRTVENCWIRRIRFINCDSGVFIHESSWFCTVQSVRFSAGPKRFVTGYDYKPDHPYAVAGHHGLVAMSYAMDNLFKDFHFDMRMLHELSTENQSTGNVFEGGDGLDMVLDHHRRAPYANLFTDINVGIGNRMWESGGDTEDGPESGAWSTFWNIRSTKPFGLPDKWEFKAVLINLIGITTNVASMTSLTGNWIEAIVPSSMMPPDLYLAQVAYQRGGSPEDTTAPSVPIGLSATADSSTQINLSWTAATDNVRVMGYKIYAGGSLLTTTTGTSYAHAGLTPSTAYVYTVEAYDAAGNTSADSNPATATTQAPPPVPPVITSAASATARVGTLFKYLIQATNGPTRFSATGLPGDLVLNTATGEFSGTPTVPGTLQITLSAINASGTGTKVLTLTITDSTDSTAPSVPSNVSASALSSSQIALTWNPSTDPEGELAGYTIFLFGSKVAVSTSTSYTATGLAPATKFKYSIAAYDASGNQSSRSSSRSATTFAAKVPTVPTGLTVTPLSASQIDVSWRASTERDGTIAGYYVYRNGVRIVNVPAPHFGDTGLMPSTTYTYRVAAYDAQGVTSNLSASDSGVTFSASYLPAPTLNLPSSMPVNGVLSAGYPSRFANIQFEWTLTLDEPAGSLGMTPAARAAAGGSRAPVANFKTIGNTASLASHALVPGRYTLSVRVFDSAGLASPSAQASVTLVTADLAAVTFYPSPWRSDRHAGVPLTFDRLPIGSTIKIFTVSGHAIKKLIPTTGRMPWDLRNEAGDTVASGIYVYLITTPDGQKTQGKFVIIR